MKMLLCSIQLIVQDQSKQIISVFYIMKKLDQFNCRLFLEIFQTQPLNFKIQPIQIIYGMMIQLILMKQRRQSNQYNFLKSKNNCWLVSGQHHLFLHAEYITISPEFQALIPAIPLVLLEAPQSIIDEARVQIQTITKRALFEQSVGQIQFLLKLYDYYETWNKLNGYQATIQTIWSVLNGSLQITSLFYFSNEPDMFISALIVLTAVNPILQMLSFAIFQKRVFKAFSTLKQLAYVFFFAIFNFLKIWDIVMICLYLGVEDFTAEVSRTFSSEAYLKFKSYASKFKGSIATSVFKYDLVQIDPKDIFQIKNQPFYEAVMWRANVEEVLNKIPQFFVYILSLSSTQIDPLWIASIFQQIKESIQAVKDILEVVIKDYFIPALILCSVSVDQFFSSMLYLSSISNQILLEYPKSFQIVSKVQEQYLREKFIFKINLKTLNFSNYADLKKQKMLAQFRYVLAQIKTVLEIDQAQRLFCMGPELNDLIRCLKVSPLYQLKLNYYLDEINPIHIPHINAFIKNCPQRLQFLQLSVESKNFTQMSFCVGRAETLKAFSFSYLQIITKLIHNPAAVVGLIMLNIDQNFLILDRYDFEQLYFEIFGNLILDICRQLFNRFTQYQVFKASVINNNEAIQNFYFVQNLISNYLEILDLTFENIRLDFGAFQFTNLSIFKMILIKCEFDSKRLRNILNNLNNRTRQVYIDMSQCSLRFTAIQQRELVRQLEQRRIDVFIKI
ncbi:unnamed protein product [Paramecium octaurelia]|uniref:Transmembrane protein n=1 Tax=Paramecium octaurelia TaxID=43137 RepID=A0A8S1UCK0_PAROT|nr:unnamed protein product [Paramecium octaurelia]